MNENVVPDVPALLAQIGTYVAELQQQAKQAKESSHQRDTLVEEKRQLSLQLTVAQRERRAQVASLQAEVASLRAQLGQAQATAAAQSQQLISAQQRADEQKAAEAQAVLDASRKQVAGLHACIAELEARCAQQEKQLQELPMLRQQLEQAAEREFQHQAQQAEAQHQHQELASAYAQLDEARQRHVRHRRQLKEQAQAYRDLKDKLRRVRREQAEELQRLQLATPAPAGAIQQIDAVRGMRSDADADHATRAPEARAASGRVGGSSDDMVLKQPLPSPNSLEAPARLPGGPNQQPASTAQHAQASSGPSPVPAGQRDAALAGRPTFMAAHMPQRSPEQPAVDVPAPKEVWPAEVAPEVGPPTGLQSSMPPAGSNGSSVGAAADDIDLTQESSPQRAQIISTQIPPPAQHPPHQQEHYQQRVRLPPGEGVHTPGRQHSGGHLQQDASVLSAIFEGVPIKRYKACINQAAHGHLVRAQGPPGQRQVEQQEKQQQQMPQGHAASSTVAPAVLGQGRHTSAVHLSVEQQQGGGMPPPPAPSTAWPTSWPGNHAQQELQRQQGGGWKRVVRDDMAAHSAFELVAPHAAAATAAFCRPGSGMTVPPLSAANGPGGDSRGGNIASDGGKQGSAGYRYQAVVRKKAEREKLQGVECLQCKRFYAALESWGTIGQETLRLECGHVQQAAGRPGGGEAGALLDRAQLQQEGSRHRYLWRPPDTQEGFWDMDVTQKPPPKGREAAEQAAPLSPGVQAAA